LYLADREASTYSRDFLEQALLDLAALPEVREINVLAHSMGNWLTVETLRQASMKGHGDFKGKLAEVLLASPDLDVNVFRTQLEVIGKLPRPITVMVSGDDKALALSTMLAGGVDRAGLITADDARAIEAARRYNLRVVDVTDVQGGDSSHHSKFSTSEAVVSAIGKGLRHEGQRKAQAGVVSAFTSVGSSILQVPAAIVGAATGQ
jgi:esterase/lipase superfamily enzyme